MVRPEAKESASTSTWLSLWVLCMNNTARPERQSTLTVNQFYKAANYAHPSWWVGVACQNSQSWANNTEEDVRFFLSSWAVCLYSYRTVWRLTENERHRQMETDLDLNLSPHDYGMSALVTYCASCIVYKIQYTVYIWVMSCVRYVWKAHGYQSFLRMTHISFYLSIYLSISI